MAIAERLDEVHAVVLNDIAAAIIAQAADRRAGACAAWRAGRRRLRPRGAQINVQNTLKHQLDFEDLNGLMLLLDHGADPNHLNDNGENALHWAIYRRRSRACLEPLVNHGVNIEHPRNDGLTPYRLALRMGHQPAIQLLRERGADISASTPIDDLLCAASAGDADTARSIAATHPDLVNSMTPAELGMVAGFADEGNARSVEILLDCGFPADARGELNGTALHWAAWKGRVDAVRVLVDHGATLEVTGANLGSTPLQWAIHASAHNPEITQEEALGVVKTLMDAGATVGGLDMGSDEVRTYVENRLRG